MRRGGAPMALASVLARAQSALGAVSSPPELTPSSYPCALCRAPIGPRPGLCATCFLRRSESLRLSTVAERALVPPRFRWARLDMCPFAPPGGAGDVVRRDALRLVQGFRGAMLVLRGDSGSGKTSLAVAKLLSDSDGGVFVGCELLAPDAESQELVPALLARAHSAPVVLLDDVGADLSGAPADSGLASYRGARVRRLLRQLHNMRHAGSRQRVILTTALKDSAIERSYGDDVLRRMTEAGDTLVVSLLPRTAAISRKGIPCTKE